ncbi:MAG: CopD family protein [bacterium]
MDLSWIKFLHVLAVAIGVGALVAEYILLITFRRSEDTLQRRASENMAYTIVKNIATHALLLAFIFGMGMIVLNTAYLKFGHIHVKMLLAVILVGMSHVEKANLRKMLSAAEAKDEVTINTLKKRHTVFISLGSVLIVAIFYLIILKPF